MPNRKVLLLMALLFYIIVVVGSISFIDLSESELNVIARSVGPWGPLILFMLIVVQAVTIFIPLTPIVLAASGVLPFWTCLLLSWSGTTVGGILSFNIGKTLGEKAWIFLGNKRAKALRSKIVDSNTVLALLPFYFSCIISFDMLNYLLGIGTICRKSALVLIAVGPIPKLVILTLAGRKLKIPMGSQYFVVVFLLLILMILVSLVLSKKADI